MNLRLNATFHEYGAVCAVGPSRAERGIAGYSLFPLAGKMPLMLPLAGKMPLMLPLAGKMPLMLPLTGKMPVLLSVEMADGVRFLCVSNGQGANT